jgi:hypothetical protein
MIWASRVRNLRRLSEASGGENNVTSQNDFNINPALAWIKPNLITPLPYNFTKVYKIWLPWVNRSMLRMSSDDRCVDLGTCREKTEHKKFMKVWLWRSQYCRERADRVRRARCSTSATHWIFTRSARSRPSVIEAQLPAETARLCSTIICFKQRCRVQPESYYRSPGSGSALCAE